MTVYGTWGYGLRLPINTATEIALGLNSVLPQVPDLASPLTHRSTRFFSPIHYLPHSLGFGVLEDVERSGRLLILPSRRGRAERASRARFTEYGQETARPDTPATV